jgi:hypothetical protein
VFSNLISPIGRSRKNITREVRQTLQKKKEKLYRDNQKNKDPLLNSLLLGLDQFLLRKGCAIKRTAEKYTFIKGFLSDTRMGVGISLH